MKPLSPEDYRSRFCWQLVFCLCWAIAAAVWVYRIAWPGDDDTPGLSALIVATFAFNAGILAQRARELWGLYSFVRHAQVHITVGTVPPPSATH